MGCILWKNYIKPQRFLPFADHIPVVSYGKTTSNHNSRPGTTGITRVVSYGKTTSNHNQPLMHRNAVSLYLMEKLHQTTTCDPLHSSLSCCILWKNYIKPQLVLPFCWQGRRCILWKNYIKPQPRSRVDISRVRCILWKNYIKPQPHQNSLARFFVVSYGKTTSNHNVVRIDLIEGIVVSYGKTTSNHNNCDFMGSS